MELPDTPAGRQVRWVLENLVDGAVSSRDIEERFAPSFLGTVPVEEVLTVFERLKLLELPEIETQKSQPPYTLIARVLLDGRRTRVSAEVEQEEPHRLVMLRFRPDVALADLLNAEEGSDEPLAELTARLFGDVTAEWSAGGVLVGVFARGSEEFGVFGDVEQNALFEIGSITKPITAVLLAEMVSRKEVSLDDFVFAHLRNDDPLPESTRAITLRHLATHTSGLPRVAPDFRPANVRNPYADFDVDQLYTSLAKTQLYWEPGSGYRYSNFGYALLGHALSRLAGAVYPDLVVDRLFGLLGMRETAVAPQGDLRERRVQGHGVSGRVVPHWDRPVFNASGGVESTIGDVLRFVRAHMEPSDTLLEVPLEDVQRPRFRIGDQSSVGLGWHILHRADESTVVWHNGMTGGFASSVLFHRGSGTAVAALANTTTHRPDNETARLLGALIN